MDNLESIEEYRQRKASLNNQEPPVFDIPLEAYQEDVSVLPGTDKPIAKSQSFTFSGGMDLFKPKPISWLIRGAIEEDSFAVIYGASGGGKSFTVIDIGLCIATGQQWHGHKVKQGQVVYVAGEGKAGIKRRITAWAQRHSGHEQIADNFLLADQCCLLPGDNHAFIDSLKEVPELRLLILDTLQRTFEGDENSTRDMTAYVQAIDDIRAAIPDLVVIVVHHTGHAADGRARGSSVLRASLDSEIRVEAKDGNIILSHTKAKESEPFMPLAFQLKTEVLEGWKDDDGKPIASATLHHMPGHDFSRATKNKVAKGKIQKAAMVVLHSLIDAQRRVLAGSDYPEDQAKVLVSDWIESCRNNPELKNAEYLKPSKFSARVIDPLLKQELINTGAGYVSIIG